MTMAGSSAGGNMKYPMSAIDWAFLQTESTSRLAHVAGLWIFKLPKGYRKNFFREFMRGLEDWTAAITRADFAEASETRPNGGQDPERRSP